MGALTLERLLFDDTDADGSPNVGAYLRSSDGTLLTHTTVGAKEALDINIAASDIDLQVDLDLSSLTADDEADDENPLKIGYRAHDGVAALTALSADGDKANAISDLYRRAFINDAPNIGGASVAIEIDDTVGGTALVATELAGRTRMFVQNHGADPLFVGFGTITTANTLEISKGSTLALEIGEALALKGIAEAGKTVDTRIMELA